MLLFSRILFFIIAFGVYALLIYFFYKKFKIANIIKSKTHKIFYISILFTLSIVPFFMFYFQRTKLETLAYIFSNIGYLWIFFLFLFLFYYLLFSLITIIIYKLKISKFIFTKKQKLISTILFCFFVLIYGHFEANNLKVESLDIKTAKITEDIKLMIISDVHFGPINNLKLAKKIKNIYLEHKPDILISTGDLLDRGIASEKEIINIFKTINPKYGNIAITGNHEYISGIDFSINFIKRANFKLLRDEDIELGGINFVGLEDLSRKNFGFKNLLKDHKVLSKVNNSNYTILLKHQAKIDTKALGMYDLQISGHTHGGQLFPHHILVSLVYPYLGGLYNLDRKSKLYVSRGTGTWGANVRFLSRPEITIINIKSL